MHDDEGEIKKSCIRQSWNTYRPPAPAGYCVGAESSARVRTGRTLRTPEEATATTPPCCLYVPSDSLPSAALVDEARF